jgi:putative transposase
LDHRWRSPPTRPNPRATPAPDLVSRRSTAAAPDRLWVADASRILGGEGAFWLPAVRDAFSDRIVGGKAGDRCNTELILAALEYGIWSRDVRDGQLIHHSDRGSNHTALRFAQRLSDNGILPSMGSAPTRILSDAGVIGGRTTRRGGDEPAVRPCRARSDVL